MIKSFRSKETEKIWDGEISTKLPQDIQNICRRKLRMLNNAATINDLRQSDVWSNSTSNLSVKEGVI
ncbi:MAG: hypothetical protein ABH886_02785 [Candidatus Desantisbacteria bacterium]